MPSLVQVSANVRRFLVEVQVRRRWSTFLDRIAVAGRSLMMPSLVQMRANVQRILAEMKVGRRWSTFLDRIAVAGRPLMMPSLVQMRANVQRILAEMKVGRRWSTFLDRIAVAGRPLLMPSLVQVPANVQRILAEMQVRRRWSTFLVAVGGDIGAAGEMTGEDGTVRRWEGDIALELNGRTLRRGGQWTLEAANGAGKTRLLLQITGRIPIRNGTLRVLGVPPGCAALRGRVSLLGDDAGLLDAATVEETVAWAIWLRDPKATARTAGTQADRILTTLDVPEALRKSRTDACSRGENRLAAIAMALGGDSVELALLDEPLSGLDADRRASVEAAINERRKHGVAFVRTAPTGSGEAPLVAREGGEAAR